MRLNLDKEDLISLVKGCTPNYSAMDHPLVKRHGNFNGSYGKWSWDYSGFENCKEQELLEIYKVCKESWK